MEHKLVFVINTQREFWRREFGGTIVKKEYNFLQVIDGLIKQGIRPVVQIDVDYAELQQLGSLPKDSIIAWCHSDEKYDLKFNKALAGLDCFYIILRPYPLQRNRVTNLIKSISYTLANLHFSKNLQEVLKSILWQFRGFLMYSRQNRILSLFLARELKFLNIPIGYTDIFALSLSEEFELEDDMSLFSFLIPNSTKQKREISFMGQSGQIVREFAIRALERESEVGTHRREGYGASQDHTAEVRKFGIEYVRSINQATFALCPPGNISGFTFRSYEVMLMNRIPLSLNYVTSDPNFLNPYSYSHMFKATRSWKNFLGEVQELDEAKILFLQELNRGKAISDLQALKEGLN